VSAAQRYSMVSLRPSVQPSSRNRFKRTASPRKLSTIGFLVPGMPSSHGALLRLRRHRPCDRFVRTTRTFSGLGHVHKLTTLINVRLAPTAAQKLYFLTTASETVFDLRLCMADSLHVAETPAAEFQSLSRTAC
jgi:hypothetical protein